MKDYNILEKKEEKYRGINYVLKLLQHSTMGLNGKWWVVENDNTKKEIKELTENIGYVLTGYSSDFLWEDSLHSWNDKTNLNEREQAMRKVAKEDIDEFLDKTLDKIQEKRIELEKLANDFVFLKKSIKQDGGNK